MAGAEFWPISYIESEGRKNSHGTGLESCGPECNSVFFVSICSKDAEKYNMSSCVTNTSQQSETQ